MKQLLSHLTIIAILFGAMSIVMAIIVVSLKKWSEKQKQDEDEYEAEYKNIQQNINNYYLNQINYWSIEDDIQELCRMKHKNREKTSVLINNFHKRFGKEYNRGLLKKYHEGTSKKEVATW